MIKTPFLYVAAFGAVASTYLLSSSDSEDTMTTKVGTVNVAKCIRGERQDPNPYSFSLRFDLAVISESQADYEKKVTHMQTKEATIKALVSDTASDIRTVAQRGLESGYDIRYLFQAEGVKNLTLASIEDLKTKFSQEVGSSYVIKATIVDPKIGCP